MITSMPPRRYGHRHRFLAGRPRPHRLDALLADLPDPAHPIPDPNAPAPPAVGHPPPGQRVKTWPWNSQTMATTASAGTGGDEAARVLLSRGQQQATLAQRRASRWPCSGCVPRGAGTAPPGCRIPELFELAYFIPSRQGAAGSVAVARERAAHRGLAVDGPGVGISDNLVGRLMPVVEGGSHGAGPGGQPAAHPDRARRRRLARHPDRLGRGAGDGGRHPQRQRLAHEIVRQRGEAGWMPWRSPAIRNLTGATWRP